MANVNQVSLGRINNPNANPALTAADNRDLYLKLASGEIFKGFENATIARDLVMKRTLTNGKSLQFIYTGRTSADYHTPGTPSWVTATRLRRLLRRPSPLMISLSPVHSCTTSIKLWLTTTCVARSPVRSATLLLKLMTARSSVRSPVVLVPLLLCLLPATLSPVVLRCASLVPV